MANYSTCDLSKGVSATEIQPIVTIKDGDPLYVEHAVLHTHTHIFYNFI